MSPQPPAAATGISVTTPYQEAQLDWYREDPLANDHHAHWHYVYPRDGTPTPSGLAKTQPRQGELFFYMHQQMLARYDTERAIVGLPPCVPFTEYDGEIVEGYELDGYNPRPGGRSATDTGLVADLTTGLKELTAALREDHLKLRGGTGDVPLEENVLGCEVESSDWYADAEDSVRAPLRYLNFHGNGHLAITSASEPRPGHFKGPMYYVETAIRDPVFYRWHRHIDNFYAEYQDGQSPTDFDRFAADVSFREAGTPDVALCLARDIPGADQPGFDFSAWGTETLGVDLDHGGPTTDELLTGFVKSDITLAEPNEQIPGSWLKGVIHLTHEPFVSFVRVENLKQDRQDVTVRLFLAHADLAEDRRLWIELDKFRATLDPGSNLLARPDARSSVVKRKGLRVPGAEAHAGQSTDVWCDCGWPYTLLLPSGASTAKGTPFKLMVAVTDWNEDRVGEPDTCGSMSFCGARNQYPDARRMGYPFERKFDDSIAATIAAVPSMTMRDLRIRCTTVRPSDA
jgi:tyrosinase